MGPGQVVGRRVVVAQSFALVEPRHAALESAAGGSAGNAARTLNRPYPATDWLRPASLAW